MWHKPCHLIRPVGDPPLCNLQQQRMSKPASSGKVLAGLCVRNHGALRVTAAVTR
jgi:hypothetical protein